jgi:hypothetical protein
MLGDPLFLVFIRIFPSLAQIIGVVLCLEVLCRSVDAGIHEAENDKTGKRLRCVSDVFS